MKRLIAKSTISRLNQIARSKERAGTSPLTAMEQAAAEIGLIEVKRDESTILFRNQQFSYVNCWIEGPMSQSIAPGGAGFDEQIDWAF